MEFSIWHYWMIATILLFMAEIFTPAFVVFNFGVGALFSTIAAAIGLSVELQILFFCVGTLISFFTVRPLAKKYIYRKSDKRVTNNHALVGREALVITTIDNKKNSGEVKVDGDIWQARTLDNSTIAKDAVVKIIDFKSITIFVEEVKE